MGRYGGGGLLVKYARLAFMELSPAVEWIGWGGFQLMWTRSKGVYMDKILS